MKPSRGGSAPAAWIAPFTRGGGLPATRPRHLLLLPAAAGLALIIAGILGGQPFSGYDANTHLFFASHYQLSWWDTWEPRWYGGFNVVSYPPLFHQLLALLGLAIGLDAAFKVLAVVLAVLFPLACFVLATEVAGKAAARIAAAASLLFPGFALILVTDGQAPGVLSLELLLFGLAAGSRYLRSGAAPALLAAVATLAASAAAHHATPLLAGPFLALALFGRRLLGRRARLPERLRRLAILALLAAAAIAITLWPFALWWLRQPAQTPIDHFSRHDFLADPGARFLGLWLPYSVWLLALPLALLAAARWRVLAPAALAGIGLFVLSLGGTTPLPSWLYGSHWEWLTYERYALWAAPLLLALSGLCLSRLRRLPLGMLCLGALPPVAALLVFAGWATWYGRLAPFEPARLDLRPAAAFLNQHDGNAYLTLGFGDQLSRLSTMTSARSIDGNYNTARSDPLLTSSGVEKLDSIRYWDPQAKTLRTFLLQPRRTGLTWVLDNDPYYDGLLSASGWTRQTLLSNGIVVWRSPAATLVAEPRHVETMGDRVEGVWWGSVPLLSLVLALSASCWFYLFQSARKRQVRRAEPLFRCGNGLRRLRTHGGYERVSSRGLPEQRRPAADTV